MGRSEYKCSLYLLTHIWRLIGNNIGNTKLIGTILVLLLLRKCPIKLSLIHNGLEAAIWDIVDFLSVDADSVSNGIEAALFSILQTGTDCVSSAVGTTLTLLSGIQGINLWERPLTHECFDYQVDIGYICVNELGERLKPNTLSAGFKRILEENGLRIIRFHDLRHSCASLLLANGVSLKHIQEWLGHSDFSTTANFYAHLDFHSKLSSAEAMQTGLGMSAP